MQYDFAELMQRIFKCDDTENTGSSFIADEECSIAARVTSGRSSCIVLVIYCPGSSAVTSSFFSELADVLDRFSTYVEPLVLAGDINVRLERSADPHAVEFRDLLVASYGLEQHVLDVTHDRGGMLDVFCTRGDLPSPKVVARDVGSAVTCVTIPASAADLHDRTSHAMAVLLSGHVHSRPADDSTV